MSAFQKDTMEERAPDMAAMVPYWDLTDTLVDGIEAMRNAGTKYLPQFPAETKDDYSFRLNNSTVMTNIFADVVETLASKPFEKDTVLSEEASDEMEEFAENVDGDGSVLSVFAAQVLYNGVKAGVDWIWVDYPEVDASVRTIADAKARNLRPYWTRVLGRNVLRCETAFDGSKRYISFIRIYEPGPVDQIRDMRVEAGQVVWTLYEKTDKWDDVKKTHYRQIKNGMLAIDEIPLVPFFTGRRDGHSFKFDPPLKAAAEQQLHLYQAETGFNHVTTLSAYPILSASGVSPDKDEQGNPKPIKRGPSVVLYAPPTGEGGSAGEWKYVEPSSNSLMFLQKRIDTIVLNLRELGRQPLTATSSNLTTVTTSFAAGKSKSAVKAWAILLKDALENAFRLTAKWMQSTESVEVSVYTEFDDFVDGKDYDALRTARDAGDISLETYWEEGKRRGLFSPRFTAERERSRLLNDIPSDNGPDLIDEGNPENDLTP